MHGDVRERAIGCAERMAKHNDLQVKKKAKMRVKEEMKSTASCVEPLTVLLAGIPIF